MCGFMPNSQKNLEWYLSTAYVLQFLLSEIGIKIFGRYSVFPAIVVDEGSPVVVIQQGLHAKGGGGPKTRSKNVHCVVDCTQSGVL